MDRKQMRRISPASRVATAAVVVLLAFEAVVVGGGVELKADTVARYAPWAYAPFMRLVGLLTGSRNGSAAGQNAASTNLTGIASMAIPMLLSPDGSVTSTNADANLPPAPATNTPPTKPEKVVPVG